MSNRIVVDLSKVEQAISGFERVLAALRRHLADLDRDLQASLASWDGDAASAYWVAHNEWQAAAADMAERLASLRGTLVTAHGNYRTSLQTNVTMWDVV
ncbi:WXG100 family type VII secretion target [Actinoallomurus soli]|uniref:WXG100 family type VII secretion target n=1 Tax=Actinoallomurus soli TaxID=2952535 RepID=UPI00209251A4|nr:WXG100 family type VII secretion target [Actinoallomurus soli]MCO5973358.1 WXG100 family type VII secretion target [Actinoallomurus soli]